MKSFFTILSRVARYLVRSYPLRLLRIVLHFFPLVESEYKLKSNSILEWFSDCLIYLLDILLLPEMFTISKLTIRPTSRMMSVKERDFASYFFNDCIDYNVIIVNPSMGRMTQKYAHAYVTFNMVNYKDRIAKEIFIHELVHIWQYQRFGSVYIQRAMKAQQSKEGYDYGGGEALYHGMLGQKRFIDYNFEQQGEIFEDYTRIIEYQSYTASPILMASFEYFIEQVRSRT